MYSDLLGLELNSQLAQNLDYTQNPRIGVRYMEPGSPVRKVKFKLNS